MIIIPFKNVHTARVSDPEQYKKIVTKDLGGGVQLLLGVLDEKDDSKTSPQSYHFDADIFKTKKDVQKWLKENNVVPTELAMAKPEKDSQEPVKENGIVTHNGEIIPEMIPIDRVPEKLFGNVRSQDVPELLEQVKEVDAKVDFVEAEPESELLFEQEPTSILEELEPEPESHPTFNIDRARQKLVDWSKNKDGSVNKRPLLKWFLDIDGGSAQSIENYRYPTGYVIDGSPQYCKLSLDASWDLAAGKQTGVANRNIQKKIIFIKNREGIPLTEEQLDFTERHMSAEKVTYHTLEDENSPGGIEFVDQTELKLNASLAGSKIIYEDDTVIDVPVVPMREGVFTGTDGIPTLKKFEYFGKDAHWLEGQPILKGHTAPTELVTYKHNRIGKLMNVTARPDKRDVVAVARYYKEKLTPEDLTRIKSGTPYDGSIAYTTHTSMTKGDLNGTKYNAVEDGGYHFYHFAELAGGTGACSTKDGCGFMLNEAGSEKEDDIIKSYYNDKRRADLVRTEDGFQVKLNAANGSNGILDTDDLDVAVDWSKVYVRSGKIPVSMKLNYRCKDSEKTGEGPGSCGGSKSLQEAMDKDKLAKEKGPKVIHPKSGGSKSLQGAMDKSIKQTKKMIPAGSSVTEDGGFSWSKKGGYAGEKLIQKYKEMYKSAGWKPKQTTSSGSPDGSVISNNNILVSPDGELEVAFSSSYGVMSSDNRYDIDMKPTKKSKQNSQFTNLTDNSMTKQNEKKGMIKDADGNECMFFEMKDKKCPAKKEDDETEEETTEEEDSEVVTKEKKNSRYGNNMTTEYISPDEDIVKMNEAFEAKLNERDAKIAELTAQVDDLVQKQNAAEQVLIDQKATADFEAFTLKLNKAAQPEAKTHYEGFKAEGWGYFDAHPEVFKADILKMNARGTPAADGDNASSLQTARDMLRKSQKELFTKRA